MAGKPTSACALLLKGSWEEYEIAEDIKRFSLPRPIIKYLDNYMAACHVSWPQLCITLAYAFRMNELSLRRQSAAPFSVYNVFSETTSLDVARINILDRDGNLLNGARIPEGLYLE